MASEAPSRPTLIDSPRVSRPTAETSAITYGFDARDVGRHARERPHDLDVGDRADLLEDVAGVLVGQVADVDHHGAEIGHLVERVAAVDAPEVDRRAVEHLGGLARERQGLDSPEHVDRLQDRVVAQPRGGAVGRAAVDVEAEREHALGLDADVQVGRLARDREVAAEAAAHDLVGGARVDVLGLLVGHADEADADGVLLGQVAQRAHHRREPALHVVGAAAVQPVALDARARTARPGRGRRRGGRGGRASARPAGPTSAVSTGSSPKSESWTSISRASSQPLMKPAHARIPSGLEVS